MDPNNLSGQILLNNRSPKMNFSMLLSNLDMLCR